MSTSNKNGYEIRADILKMSKELLEFQYANNLHVWEMSVDRDEKTGRVLNTKNAPKPFTIDHVLDTAEEMYRFVNNITK